MPRKALTHDLASATVRYLRINADQTTTELTAAALRTAIGAFGGVQYLTANAAWDGSMFILNDGTARTVNFAAATFPIACVIVTNGANITLSNTHPGGAFDGIYSAPQMMVVNSDGSDGSLFAL